MEPQLGMLIRLQELDTRIMELRRKLEEIPKVIDELRGKYQEAERALEDGRADQSTLQKERRQAERNLDVHLEKIRKINEQQYQVKTNKEYQALLSEIDNLRRQQGELEDRILALMEDGSEAEKKIAGLEKEVSKEKTTFQERESRLLAEAESLKSKLEEVEAKRRDLVPGVTEENLQTYTKVMKYRGVAVVEAREEVCLGCRVSLPPQKYADVMRNDSVNTCSHCKRILYYREEAQPGEGKA